MGRFGFTVCKQSQIFQSDFNCLLLGTELTEKIQDWSGIEIFALMGMGHGIPFIVSLNTKEFTQMSTISVSNYS